MTEAIGLGIIIVIAILIGTSRDRKNTHRMTREQKQDLTEQITVIQPIIRDDFKK